MKRFYRPIGILLFLISIAFILEGATITGALIGRTLPSTMTTAIGLFLLVFSLLLMTTKKEEDLEERVEEHHWKKYPVAKESVIRDIEEAYLTARKEYQRTPLQERIERSVHGGRLIGRKRNLRRTYAEQLEEGHAGIGGRVIDVVSHIPKTGKYKGRLVHFGHPMSARYIWVVDEDGNFIVGNHQFFHHEMPHMKQQKVDYPHRLHKLPHATLARGKGIYGSGEVMVEGGKVKAYNTASGHYIDLKDIRGFNEQGKEVFEDFVKRVGWEAAPGGARYQAKH